MNVRAGGRRGSDKRDRGSGQEQNYQTLKQQSGSGRALNGAALNDHWTCLRPERMVVHGDFHDDSMLRGTLEMQRFRDGIETGFSTMNNPTLENPGRIPQIAEIARMM